MLDWSAGTSDRGELSAEDAGVIVELQVDTIVQVGTVEFRVSHGLARLRPDMQKRCLKYSRHAITVKEG